MLTYKNVNLWHRHSRHFWLIFLQAFNYCDCGRHINVQCSLQVREYHWKGGEVQPSWSNLVFTIHMWWKASRRTEYPNGQSWYSNVSFAIFGCLLKRELSKKAKLSFFKAVFIPFLTVTCGHESWVLTERTRSQLDREEWRTSTICQSA